MSTSVEHQLGNGPAAPFTRQAIAALGKVGVVGAGVSGLAAIRLLRVLSPEAMTIIVVDDRHQSPAIKDLGAKLRFDATGEVAALADAELIVVSPGVAPDHPVYGLAGVAIISEIDLAYCACPVAMIGVTGTNGKSTATQLIADLGQGLGLNTVAGGNIGIAAAQLAAELIEAEQAASPKAKPPSEPPSEPPLWILELSSYQLEQSRHIRLKGAVFTSFSEDHQERHKNLARYFAAKWEIINRISTGGFLVIHKETLADIKALMPEQTFGWREELSLMVIAGSQDQGANAERKSAGVRVNGNRGDERQDLYSSPSAPWLSKYFLQKDRSLTDAEGSWRQPLSAPFCQYHHNLHNAALAVLCLKALRPSGGDEAVILTGLEKFTGLAHRFQPLLATAKLAIINDSKSTNLESLLAALASASEASRDIVLLVGGVAGSPSYRKLNHYHDKLKWVLCFGKDGDKIYTELNSISRKSYSPDLASALALAIEHIEDHLARPKRKLVVLFSPGCKSFDEFANFSERGAFFVRTIKSAKGFKTWHDTR